MEKETKEILDKLCSDVAEILTCLKGDDNPLNEQPGVIKRLGKVECRVEKFIDWKVWVLGAFAGVTALGGLVFTIITILS